MNELEKLYVLKKGKQITIQDLGKYLENNITYNIFNTIEEIAKGDKKKSLRLLLDHFKNGEDPFYLFAMIIYQFRNLLKVKWFLETEGNCQDIAKKVRLHPFVVSKCITIGNNFQYSKLKLIYKKLSQIDYSIKKGRMDLPLALQLFIISI
jgi:DNA polymerase-3 subunit delta